MPNGIRSRNPGNKRRIIIKLNQSYTPRRAHFTCQRNLPVCVEGRMPANSGALKSLAGATLDGVTPGTFRWRGVGDQSDSTTLSKQLPLCQQENLGKGNLFIIL